MALFDVRLPKPKGNKTHTVVQPDLIVICDTNKIDEAGCDGVPDFIIEIVSPSSIRTDTKIKYELYAEMGVREYWIVFPGEKSVQQFLLQENQTFKLNNVYLEDEIISSEIFPELQIPLNDIFGKSA